MQYDVSELDFEMTCNVDHCFPRSGFNKERLLYTQRDYGLWQCSLPCHQKNYDNLEQVEKMVALLTGMRVPSELVQYCPRCGRPMTMNLRIDESFVEDDGWHRVARLYARFIGEAAQGKTVYLERGVGEYTGDY